MSQDHIDSVGLGRDGRNNTDSSPRGCFIGDAAAGSGSGEIAGVLRWQAVGVGLTVRKASWRELLVVEVPLLALLALVFAVSLLVNPEFELRESGIGLPWLYACPLFELTGIPCLLCGMTRSFLAMGGFDLGQALIFHPLGPALYLFMIVLAAGVAVALASRRRVSVRLEPALRRGLITLGTLILLSAWVVKVLVWRQTGLL